MGMHFVLPSSAVLLASSNLYPQAFKLGSCTGILFHLEITSQMIHEWTKDYGSEMKEVGVTLADILDGKKSEFDSLANYCKVVHENFSKTITAYMNTKV